MERRLCFVITLAALLPLLLTAAPAAAQDAGAGDSLHLIGKWGQGSCWAVTVDGSRVLVGNGSVLEVCAHGNDGTLEVIGQVTLPSPVEGIAVAGDLAYVASRDAGLRIVDFSDRLRPVEVGAAWVPDDVYDVAVVGNYAYVAADGDGLRIIDVSNPAAPFETGFVDTDGYALKLKVAGSHVYLADGSAGSGGYGTMRVIDVSNPAAPFLAGSHEMTQSSYTYAWCLDVVGNLVYVGYDFGYIAVVDVSNPAAPVQVGGFDQGLDNIQGMHITGGLMYVAYSWRGLGVFDLADPLYPVPLAVADTPQDARRLCVAGGRAYVADQEGGLQIFDVTNPAVPLLEQAHATPGNSHDLAVRDGWAYVADEMFGLRILDLRNRRFPHQEGELALPGTAVTVDVMDGHAYVAAGSAGLRVVDVRDPAAPVEVGSWDLGGSFESVTAHGGLVYATESGGPLRIFDVADPTDPVQVGGYTSTFRARHTAYKDGYLICAQRNTYNSFWVLDVSVPAATGSVYTLDLPGISWDVAVLGDHAYLSAGSSGVYILNVANPATPSYVGTFDPSDGANGLETWGDFLHVAGGGRVWMLEVSNPAAPAWSGWFDTGGVAWEIAMLDGDLVVADHDDGVLVLRNELVMPGGAGDGPPPAPAAVSCHPNPCNPATTITFAVPRPGPVRLDILDARGRRVARLVDAPMAAGPARVVWRGLDDGGRAVASGAYFVKVETAAGPATGRVVLVR